MESLKDLPSYNKDNFSNFTQGLSKTSIKSYLRVKKAEESIKPLEIVTDMESLMLKDFEREARKRERKRLNRSPGDSPTTPLKMSRTDEDCEQPMSS